MILYIKHIDIEGPETLGVFLKEQGFESKTIEMGRNHMLPDNLDGIDAVIGLGGPMNVDEEDKYPFLKSENEFLKKVIEKGVPYLGLCLGSQLLAKAAGAKVGKSPHKEVGFSKVQLTNNGKDDILFTNVCQEFDAYQWHEDMWELPCEAALLAESSLCPHQAFKVGTRAYGLQFHVEITDKNIVEWSDAYMKGREDLELKKNAMVSDYTRVHKSFSETAQMIYNNFVKIIQAYKND